MSDNEEPLSENDNYDDIDNLEDDIPDDDDDNEQEDEDDDNEQEDEDENDDNEQEDEDENDDNEQEDEDENDDNEQEDEDNREENLDINNENDIDNLDDEDEDEEYLQKFNNNILTNFLEDIHPETKIHNTDEVLGMTKIIRDENGNIIDNNHKTIPILTKYEKTRILGIRAKQIDEGSNIFTNVSNKILDGYTIALKEFNEKKIPFIIKRPLPDGSCEYWNLKDLEII